MLYYFSRKINKNFSKYDLMKVTCPINNCCRLLAKSYKTPICAATKKIFFVLFIDRLSTGISLLNPKHH
jgi:uncharacterized protein (UPF0305 family)